MGEVNAALHKLAGYADMSEKDFIANPRIELAQKNSHRDNSNL